jgi:hypothetical protein
MAQDTDYENYIAKTYNPAGGDKAATVDTWHHYIFLF